MNDRNRQRIFRALRRFATAEDGTVTAEFIIWVPAFMALILLTADVSLAFMRQSNFWTISRDTARIVARHGLDPVAAERYAAGRAGFGGYTPDVSVRVDALAWTVTVKISGEAARMAPFGMLGLAMSEMGEKVSAEVTQTLEPI